MPGNALYWRDWSEAQLAAYQGDQGGSNHCAKFAAASALNLLYEKQVAGEDLVSWVEARPLKGTGRYTIYGNNNGSLVFQTANLLRQLASMLGISPRIQCQISDTSDLLTFLTQEHTLALVSLTYFQGNEPLIARGHNITSSLGPARFLGGHIMIPAAFDPAHVNQVGTGTPWGFLSSWGSNDQLYWMTESDFQRTWGSFSIYNTVIVDKKED
jgi:hypothetical protein